MYKIDVPTSAILPWHRAEDAQTIGQYMLATKVTPIIVYELPEIVDGCRFLVFEGHHRRKAKEGSGENIKATVVQNARDLSAFLPKAPTQEEYESAIQRALQLRTKAIFEGRLNSPPSHNLPNVA